MTIRRFGSLVAAVLVAAATMIGVSASPALAASCYYPGGGMFGADTAGFLPPQGTGGVQTQQIIYGLVGYSDLPAGCASGELDLVAYTVPGTPGTCTLVLPKPVISGAGCDNLLGNAGAGTEVLPVQGFRVTIYAELVAVGTDGTRVTRVSSPCSNFLDAHYYTSFRCPL